MCCAMAAFVGRRAAEAESLCGCRMMRPTTERSVRTLVAAVACVGGSVYALSGYVMAASFSVSNPEQVAAFRKAALAWGAGSIVLALTGAWLAASWWRGRRGDARARMSEI